LTDEREGNADVETVRNGFEDLARSLHVSYLNRWGRHDPAGLEREIETKTEQPAAGGGRTSAA
jgi:hypothetical protein